VVVGYERLRRYHDEQRLTCTGERLRGLGIRD